jgi:hypothetical protein
MSLPIENEIELNELFTELTDLASVLPPVPNIFEKALAYPDYASTSARYLSFYYSSLGDESVYDDGRQSGDGDAWAFLDFINHNKIWPHLRVFDFGSSETEGIHRLLLDRVTRKLYVGPTEIVARIVLNQWQPVKSDIPLPREQVASLIEAMLAKLTVIPSPTELLAMVRERHSLVTALIDWLDRNASPIDSNKEL